MTRFQAHSKIQPNVFYPHCEWVLSKGVNEQRSPFVEESVRDNSVYSRFMRSLKICVQNCWAFHQEPIFKLELTREVCPGNIPNKLRYVNRGRNRDSRTHLWKTEKSVRWKYSRTSRTKGMQQWNIWLWWYNRKIDLLTQCQLMRTFYGQR